MTRSARRASVRSHAPADRASLYQDITDRIIAELEAGRLPWVQPWGSAGVSAPLGLPSNAATGRNYSGINVLILWGAVVQRGYAVQSWLTFRQAVGLGGNVRKGERGTTVVYADRFVPDDERRRAHDEGEAPRSIPFLKRFTVFNVEQCEGLPDGVVSAPPPIDNGLILPQVEALIRAIGADIRIGGDKAYYDVAGDLIRVPPPQAFFEPINWHRTALHEVGHLVGRRLGRDLSGAFGSKKYAYEEIVCELSTSFVCAALGIVPTVRHTDYIGSWCEILQGDDRAIVRAASAASKAADYLLSFLPDAAASKAHQHEHRQPSGHLRARRDREAEGRGGGRDGIADAGREAPGRPVADNQLETLPWPSRNPRSP
ncbi:MAG TPA: ArdC-like ssDNA-binding domain-containing protein [Hyphomicrobiaceae bacterium]|jgi:antirestriction protein ArdC